MIVTIWTYEITTFFIGRLRPSVKNMCTCRTCPHFKDSRIRFFIHHPYHLYSSRDVTLRTSCKDVIPRIAFEIPSSLKVRIPSDCPFVFIAEVADLFTINSRIGSLFTKSSVIQVRPK